MGPNRQVIIDREEGRCTVLLWREDGGQAKQQAALLLSGPDIRPGDGGPLAPLPRSPGPRHLLFSDQVVVAVQAMQSWWAVMMG